MRVARCPDEASLEALRRDLHGEQIALDTSPGFRVVLARGPAHDTVLSRPTTSSPTGWGRCG